MARRHTPDRVIAKARQGQKVLNEHRLPVEFIKDLDVQAALSPRRS